MHLLPPARISVVRTGHLPTLCKTDEIGEICVQSAATGAAYWGLQGKTAHAFRYMYMCYTVPHALFRVSCMSQCALRDLFFSSYNYYYTCTSFVNIINCERY